MRSRTLFLLAIVMGLITTLVFAFTFSSKNKESEIPEETQKVIVSTQMIEENTVITEEMVTETSKPRSSVHASSLNTVDQVIGKLATTRIESDEVLLPARVQSVQQINDVLSKKITEGKQAISIRANLVQSVSNLIEAEDFVDVLFTEIVSSSTDPVVKTSLLYGKVRVLAIGQKMTVRDENDELVEYSSVTIEIDPKDTVSLVQAHESGTLHLTLHRREVTTNN